MPNKKDGTVVSQVRLEITSYQKMKIIAKSEGRSINAQLDYFMRKGVEAYERENGEIILSDEE